MDKIQDENKVRLGGFAPTVAPGDVTKVRMPEVKDAGRVHIGGGAIHF